MSRERNFNEVNKDRRRVDGIGLVTGRALFTDDYDLPGMLSAKVLGARIRTPASGPSTPRGRAASPG